MSKQINLSLAKSGDVAVLRNETQHIILETGQSKAVLFPVRLLVEGIDIYLCYTNEGQFSKLRPHDCDILDILRNGVSIFEPK